METTGEEATAVDPTVVELAAAAAAAAAAKAAADGGRPMSPAAAAWWCPPLSAWKCAAAAAARSCGGPVARRRGRAAWSGWAWRRQADPAACEREVKTFTGSKDDGNTFPGASAPFGLIQGSPIGSHYSGWRYDDEKSRGFGHSFISGAGCWEQRGQVSVLPVTGLIAPGGDFDTGHAHQFAHKPYASPTTPAGRQGQPGS